MNSFLGRPETPGCHFHAAFANLPRLFHETNGMFCARSSRNSDRILVSICR